MTRSVSNMFLAILHCLVLCGSTRILKMVHKPYGPKMCMRLCSNAADTFTYIKEDLSCRWIKNNNSRNMEESFISLAAENMMTHSQSTMGMSGNGSCTLASEDAKPSENLLDCRTLHQACEKGRIAIVRYILFHNPDIINCRGRIGLLPVMSAAKKGHVRVFDFLVKRGCDLFALNEYKNNVLHEACKGGSINIVRKLLDRTDGKLDIESRGWGGRTPLMEAARYGRQDVVLLLVAKGCNPNVVDDSNDNILHVVCSSGWVSLAEYILSQCICEIDSKGFHRRTPVMMAAQEAQRAMVEFLVRIGCNLQTVNYRNDNILHIACVGGSVNTVKYIMSLNVIDMESKGSVGRTPLMKAAEYGRRKVFDLLVKRGYKLRVVDKENSTLLHVACIGGHVEMVRHILSQNIFSIESRGFEGRTPVMTAVEKGHRRVFDLLRSEGCNLIAVDNSNNSIIHLACIGGHVDMMEYLMTLGIGDTMRKNKYGQTPALVAELNGHRGIISLLEPK